jgi:hypothetical protein
VTRLKPLAVVLFKIEYIVIIKDEGYGTSDWPMAVNRGFKIIKKESQRNPVLCFHMKN